jgi:hypothetical protein
MSANAGTPPPSASLSGDRVPPFASDDSGDRSTMCRVRPVSGSTVATVRRLSAVRRRVIQGYSRLIKHYQTFRRDFIFDRPPVPASRPPSARCVYCGNAKRRADSGKPSAPCQRFDRGDRSRPLPA